MRHQGGRHRKSSPVKHRNGIRPQEAPADRHDRCSNHRCGRDRRGRHVLQQIRGTAAGPLPVHLPASNGFIPGGVREGRPCLVRRSDSIHECHREPDPDVVMYYSGWYVPFPDRLSPRRWLTTVRYRSCRWIRMDISIAAIASGQYDGYLSAYAEAVRAYRHPVILSFGHEMNGDWYSWGYRHTIADDFRGRLAAHRHAVPCARSPERDVAVDRQHHQQHADRQDPTTRPHGGPAMLM